MRKTAFILTLLVVLPAFVAAQAFTMLKLPNQEELSSGNILHIMQDCEGMLWYATEGGGLCRDDGHTVDVFRNDASHPDLLGANNIASVAETGQYIVIGTYHGAYILSKTDYGIRRLEEVDDNRVDDILVTRDNRVLLTANKKIYEFSAAMKHVATYHSRWKGREVYVSHLFEDRSGHLWATQWDGGLLKCEGHDFAQQPWPLEAPPTDIADGPASGSLWVGTVGQGVVLYHSENGKVDVQPQVADAVCIDLQLSADGRYLWMITMNDLFLLQTGNTLTILPTDGFVPQGEKVLHKLSLDHHGNLLVAGSNGSSFAVAGNPPCQWYNGIITDGGVKWMFRERQGLVMAIGGDEQTVDVGQQLLPVVAPRKDGGLWATDGKRLYICTREGAKSSILLPWRPSAMADDRHGGIWISTGRDVRLLSTADSRELAVVDLPDVSAMVMASDGILWMGTIYGKLYQYKNGILSPDAYACNEYGDAILALSADSLGRLTLACDRYVRIYDKGRKTLRQQSRETDGIYSIQLAETKPGARWTQPQRAVVLERMPAWLTSWWMIIVYVLLLASLALLLVSYFKLRGLRKRFVEQMKEETAPAEEQNAEPNLPTPPHTDDFTEKAIAAVEAHLSDDSYSVEQLSGDMCMSRMTLYRKIQTATGQKPTEFIRTVRLRRAADMLREGRLSVTEISYATGFSSVSYFSRCFRTMYNMSPSQYGNRTTADMRPSSDTPKSAAATRPNSIPDKE